MSWGDKSNLVEETVAELTLENKSLAKLVEVERAFRDVTAKAANSTYSIDEFLQGIFPYIITITQSFRGSIAIRSQNPLGHGTHFYIVTHDGIPDAGIKNRLIDINEADYLKKALDSGNYIVIGAQRDCNYSSIVMPFCWDGEYQGAVCVSTNEGPHTQDDVALLSSCIRHIENQIQLILEKERVIQAYIACVEARDPYVAVHNVRVGQLASLIASECGKSVAEQYMIQVYGSMHDVGKIGVSDVLLLKEGGLEDDEFKLIKSHTLKGEEIVGDAMPLCSYARPIIRNHHEWYDGSGYPDCLSGTNISEAARIVAVADAFDAMNSNRCYRNRLDGSEIVRLLRDGKERQFDPVILNAFLKILPDIAYTEIRGDEEQMFFHRPFCKHTQNIPRGSFVVDRRVDIEKIGGYVPCPNCYN
jgi:HD-GYP domain-containing protein (c-di-GMP phosphodiesterase class II)